MGILSDFIIFQAQIGISPCPESMKDYSFIYQMLTKYEKHNTKGHLHNLYWNMNINKTTVVDSFEMDMNVQEHKSFPFSQMGELWLNEFKFEPEWSSSHTSEFNLNELLEAQGINNNSTAPLNGQNVSFYIPLGELVKYLKF
jgi:hypothetical protein